jgi:predicted Fe-Mo cluster-binding NifX family protein
MQFEALPNPNLSFGGGVGIQSASLMAEKGANVVLTGNCGPNAFRTFEAAGIQVVTGVSGIVRAAVERFKNGLLKESAAPNQQSRCGGGRGGGKGLGRGLGMGGGKKRMRAIANR